MKEKVETKRLVTLCGVSDEQWKEIRKAAIDADLTVGDYLAKHVLGMFEKQEVRND